MLQLLIKLYSLLSVLKDISIAVVSLWKVWKGAKNGRNLGKEPEVRSREIKGTTGRAERDDGCVTKCERGHDRDKNGDEN